VAFQSIVDCIFISSHQLKPHDLNSWQIRIRLA
jgi:hypothetical protein